MGGALVAVIADDPASVRKLVQDSEAQFEAVQYTLRQPKKGKQASILKRINQGISEWAKVVMYAAENALYAPWARMTTDLQRKSNALKKALNDIDKPGASEKEELALLDAYVEYHKAIPRAVALGVEEAKMVLEWLLSVAIPAASSAIATMEKATKVLVEAKDLLDQEIKVLQGGSDRGKAGGLNLGDATAEYNRAMGFDSPMGAAPDPAQALEANKKYETIRGLIADQVRKKIKESGELGAALIKVESYYKKTKKIADQLESNRQDVEAIVHKP